ncbi:MAG: hypothetical protein DI589_21255 [Shinella sp.]|nr:MAG: hypothetical protein DI589_21255 [Shinella sp.]
MRLPILLAALMPLAALTACSTTGPVDCERKDPKKPMMTGSCNEGHATPLLRRPKPPLTHGKVAPLLRPVKKVPVREPIGSEHEGGGGGGPSSGGNNSSTGGGGYTHGKI